MLSGERKLKRRYQKIKKVKFKPLEIISVAFTFEDIM
jgi:hypothetical protein